MINYKKQNKHIFMASSEMRGLVKVGGLGDVVFDLSNSIAQLDNKVSVCIPYYEIIKSKTDFLKKIIVDFAGASWEVELYKKRINKIDIYLIKSRDFFSGDYGSVYINSNLHGKGPFEDDAKRFAFFSTAVLEILKIIQDLNDIEVLHCHDWHLGALFFQINYYCKYKELLNRVKTVFTIHNLDYQGARPYSSKKNENLTTFVSWFPDLKKDFSKSSIFKKIMDNKDGFLCFNPLKASINLADMLTTVSPTYAVEITKPNSKRRNFIGGCGLQKYLKKRLKKNQLIGVLNGLDYSIEDPEKLETPFGLNYDNWYNIKSNIKNEFLINLPNLIKGIYSRNEDKPVNSADILKKIEDYKFKEWKERILIVAVTRAAEQKVGFLLQDYSKKITILEEMLKKDVSLVILGTGEKGKELNDFMYSDNAIFINTFDAKLAKRMYSAGDLFLMPSFFEPCGISQMISMRYGCLPMVNDVGGLHDTVIDNFNGFIFSGRTSNKQKKSFFEVLDSIIGVYYNDREKWRIMQTNAMQTRFYWNKQADKYLNIYNSLYDYF